jgi:NADH dehydrogenase
LLDAVSQTANLKPMLVPIPFSVWRAAAWFAERFPSAPLTQNQVELMEIDNVASAQMPGFGALGISPRSVEEAVTEILWDH